MTFQLLDADENGVKDDQVPIGELDYIFNCFGGAK